jgi:hypothetical protein
MPTLRTEIRTERAERYLHQFGKHADAMNSPRAQRIRSHDTGSAHEQVALQIDRTDTSVTVRFQPWGTCTLETTADLLTVHIDATDDESLARIRDILTRDLERFGHGDLVLTWTDNPAPGTGGSAR